MGSFFSVLLDILANKVLPEKESSSPENIPDLCFTIIK
jgi:hypothetical protein